MKFNRNILYPLAVFLLVLMSACRTSQKPAVSKAYLQYLADSTSSNFFMEDVRSGGLDYFINGEKLEQQGFYANAILEYLEALRYDTNAVIYYALGKNYLKLNKFSRAEEYFKRALFIDSTFIPALDKLGELYIETYNKDEAIKTYEQLVKLEPSHKNLRELAFLYEFDDLKKAAEIYERLLSQKEDFYLLTKLSSIYNELQDSVKYVEYLERAYQLNKENSDVIIELFDVYIAKGQISKAETLISEVNNRMFQDELSEMFQRFSFDLLNYQNRSLDPLKKNLLDYIDSRFYFDWRLQSLSGMLASQINDTTKAEKFFKRAMTVADSVPDVPLQLANFYLNMAQYDKALAIVDEYSPKHPDNEDFYLIAGFAYLMMDNLNEASEYFHKTIAINPKNIDGYIQLGILHDQMNNSDSSDYYYKKALELDPENPLVNNNFAYSLSLRKKDLDLALKMSEISLDAEPDNVAYLDTYGWILFQMGNYEEALKYLLKAIELGGGTGEFYLHLGEIYQAMGKKEDAIDAWRKGLEIEPENKDIKKRLDLIK